jgi:hypothetical protein
MSVVVGRLAQVEMDAGLVTEPERSLLRASLVAIRQGRLGVASRVVGDLANRRAELRWLAFLVALEATEWKLGGALAIETPERWVERRDRPPCEQWGVFGMALYPEGERARVRLVELSDGRRALITAPTSAAPCYSCAMLAALDILAREVEAFLGRRVLNFAR